MNKKRMLIGATVAIVVGLLAGRYVYRSMQQAKAVQPVAVGKIVVAATRLQVGARLRAQDLRLIDWPSATRIPGSFGRIEDCAERAVIVAQVENQPILEENLAPKGSGAGLPAAIPEGMRAVSVRVDDVVSVAGFTMPGTMVDVQVTGDLGGGGITHTILEYVRVLAAGQKIEQDKDGKPQTVNVVTLLVDPQQADKLTMASTSGRIHLALRNTIDTKKVEPPPVYMTSLFGGGRPKPQEAAKRGTVAPQQRLDPKIVIEVIRGEKKETTTFTQ